MKPGNLFIQGAKSVGKTRDKDSIERTSGPSVCGFLFLAEKSQIPIGFQSPAFPNTAENRKLQSTSQQDYQVLFDRRSKASAVISAERLLWFGTSLLLSFYLTPLPKERIELWKKDCLLLNV